MRESLLIRNPSPKLDWRPGDECFYYETWAATVNEGVVRRISADTELATVRGVTADNLHVRPTNTLFPDRTSAEAAYRAARGETRTKSKALTPVETQTFHLTETDAAIDLLKRVVVKFGCCDVLAWRRQFATVTACDEAPSDENLRALVRAWSDPALETELLVDHPEIYTKTARAVRILDTRSRDIPVVAERMNIHGVRCGVCPTCRLAVNAIGDYRTCHTCRTRLAWSETAL